MKQNTAVICLSPVNGGMELAAVKLARLLSDEAAIDFIAKKNGFIASKDHFTGYDVTLHTVVFSSSFSIRMIKEVRKILIAKKIKNIIFLGASEMKSLYFASKGLDINFIIRQGSKKTTSKKDILHRLVYSDVDHFVGNCEYVKQNIKDILPVAKHAKVHRIYSSVNLDENICSKANDGVINLVHVGRIHPGKGQFEAIQACEVLNEKGYDFDMKFLGEVQDRQYYESIKTYLKTLDYNDRIHFTGYTTNVKQYLQESDIFLFPSLGEGMSNAIIEALGYGLIPVIYNDTSSPEFKDLGFHIYLTEENNVDNLKKKLLYVAVDMRSQKEQAAINYNLALEVFSPQREKKEYLTLIY